MDNVRWRSRLVFAVSGLVAAILASLIAEKIISWINGDIEVRHMPALISSYQSFKKSLADNPGVKISLLWENKEFVDLDLHVVDARGEHLFFKNMRAICSSGILIKDVNAEPPFTDRAKETILWKPGEAPEGKYEVYVAHYKTHGTGEEPVPYSLEIHWDDKVKKIDGSIAAHELPQRVYEFNVAKEKYASFAGFMKSLLLVALWGALLALGISLTLVGAQIIYLKKQLLIRSDWWRIILGSAVTGLIAGAAGQLIYGISCLTYTEIPGRPIGWIILGGLLVNGIKKGLAGVAPGLTGLVPNLSIGKYTRYSGVLAGFLGYFAFNIISEAVSDPAGRLLGAIIIGFLVGLMVAVKAPSPGYIEIKAVEPRVLQPSINNIRVNTIKPYSVKLTRSSF